jgi:hypothetical protein
MTFFILATILAGSVVNSQRYKYAKGTHQRYVYATWRIILNYATIVLFIISAGIALNMSDYFVLIADVFIITMSIFLHYLEKRIDDDNWFNGRWNKIKNGIKNLSQSLQRKTAAA